MPSPPSPPSPPALPSPQPSPPSPPPCGDQGACVCPYDTSTGDSFPSVVPLTANCCFGPVVGECGYGRADECCVVPPPPSPPSPPPSPPSPPASPPDTFTSKASLKAAVLAFTENADAAIATYGPFADWDVSGVSDMSYLFNNLQNFDADISSWDTSSVTDMSYMFYVRSAHALAPSAFTARPSRRACRSCAAAGQCPPASRPAPHSASYALPPPSHTSLRIIRPPFDSAVRVGVQPAAELRHVQRHGHELHVLRALSVCPRPPAFSRALSPFMPLAPPSPHARARRTSPRIVRPPFDSAVRKLPV